MYKRISHKSEKSMIFHFLWLNEFESNHEVFDKNGMKQGDHNGDPKRSLEMLVLRSML